MYNVNKYYIHKDKETIYISKKLNPTLDTNNNQIQNYDIPVKYKFNIQPISADSETREFGELTNRMKVAIANKNIYQNKFNEFDLAYLDGNNPTGETKNGHNANYRIYSVRPQNSIIKIYFLKIVK